MWYVIGAIILAVIIAIIIKALRFSESVSTYHSSTSPPLSRKELRWFTSHSVDPQPWGPIVRANDNVHLTDEELRRRLEERTREGKPTALLRLEYQRRLNKLESNDEWCNDEWWDEG